MDIVLHIGTQKTGTTSWQQAFIQQADVLLQHGVLYPTFRAQSSHLELAARFYGDTYDAIVPSLNFDPKDQIMATADAMWDQIAEDVQRHKPALLMLSYERFWEMQDKAGFVAHLNRLFPGARLHVAAYLREPVGFFVSLTQQRLKWRKDLRWPHSLGIAQHLSEWRALAPLTLREFDRAVLQDGDAASDVLTHLLQGRVPRDALSIPRRNESLSTESCQVVAELLTYAANPGKPAGRRNLAAAMRVLKVAEDKMPPRHPVTPLTLRPGMTDHILAAAKSDLRGLDQDLDFRFRGLAWQDIADGPDDRDEWVPFDAVFELDRENVERFRAVAMRTMVRSIVHLREKLRDTDA